VAETLQRTGTVGFWKVAMKPGRPLAFGRIGDALFFGLPGNPNSVMATFYQLVQPALQALAGIPNPEPPFTMPAISASALRKKPGRREFQRGVLSRSDDGRAFRRRTADRVQNGPPGIRRPEFHGRR
jgi:molybdopterin molybdotransferase